MLVRLEVEELGQRLVVLQRPPTRVRPDDPDQAAVLETAGDPLDLLLVVVGDRVAAARLVARRAQRVERERIAAGDSDLLLQQAPQDALLGGVEERDVGHVPTLSTPYSPDAPPRQLDPR